LANLIDEKKTWLLGNLPEIVYYYYVVLSMKENKRKKTHKHKHHHHRRNEKDRRERNPSRERHVEKLRSWKEKYGYAKNITTNRKIPHNYNKTKPEKHRLRERRELNLSISSSSSTSFRLRARHRLKGKWCEKCQKYHRQKHRAPPPAKLQGGCNCQKCQERRRHRHRRSKSSSSSSSSSSSLSFAEGTSNHNPDNKDNSVTPTTIGTSCSSFSDKVNSSENWQSSNEGNENSGDASPIKDGCNLCMPTHQITSINNEWQPTEADCPMTILEDLCPNGRRYFKYDPTLNTPYTYYYWKVPQDVRQVKVTLTGGGGAGAGSKRDLYLRGGGGGGAAASIIEKVLCVTSGDVITIQVGCGGSGYAENLDGRDGYPSKVHYGMEQLEAENGFGGKSGKDDQKSGGLGGKGGVNQHCPKQSGCPGEDGTMLPPSFGISCGGDGGSSNFALGGLGGTGGSGGNSYFSNGGKGGIHPFGIGQAGSSGSGGGGSAPVSFNPVRGGDGGDGFVLFQW